MSDNPHASPTADNAPAAGRPREVFAWAMYDWANSAYSTISIVVLMGYIRGVLLPGDLGKVVWVWGIGLSMLIAAVLSPVLGAMADAQANKRKWLAVTALSGAATAVAMALVPSDWPWVIVALFVLTALCFELSLGFYNGFLPEIADEESMNRVSAWGYALGYIGGALALVLTLAVLTYGPNIGLPNLPEQLRAGLLIMGLWWGLFTLPTILVLRDRARPPTAKQPIFQLARSALGEVGATLRNIRRYKMLALFLLGFLFYNDGIQTVISQASSFAKSEFDFTPIELAKLVLVIQLLAFPGAIFIGRLADRIGQKPTVIFCLVIWIGLVVTAYFVTAKWQFWILGGVLATVMGGTQSVSRAIMGKMTPPTRTAEFFGFFNLSGKATSFLGASLYGLIIVITGNDRLAILSLLVFFVIGLVLVAQINIAQGRRQALEE